VSNEKLLHSSGVWASMIKVPAWLGFDKGPFLSCRQVTSPYSLSLQQEKKEQELSGASFMRTPILFTSAPPSRPICLPKAPSFNTITLRVRIAKSEFQWDTNIQSITWVGSEFSFNLLIN
jgi:hypothetical protein